MTKVKNINGTSPNKCGCGSWLDHWKKFSGQGVPLHCPEVNCRNKPEVGAHVQKESYTDRTGTLFRSARRAIGKQGSP